MSGNRIPKGVSAGGQFDPDSRAEDESVALNPLTENSCSQFTAIPADAKIISPPMSTYDSQGEPVVGSRYEAGGREVITLAGKHGTVELWQQEWPDASSRHPMDGHQGGLEVHRITASSQHHQAHDGCQSVESGTCYPDGSSYAYDGLRFAFLMQGRQDGRILLDNYESLRPAE